MADTMQFDLVSPERRLASMDATEVLIPGAEGDLTAMPAHEAVITTLRPGVLRVSGADGVQEFLVSGGFAEITGDSASVLAERAMPKADATREFLDALKREAEEAHAKAQDDDKDAAAKTVADIEALLAAMV